MNSSPRGFGLVISNVSFDSCSAPGLDPRKGGEVDDEVLRKVFTELDYHVSVHRDLTAQVQLQITPNLVDEKSSFHMINLNRKRKSEEFCDIK